VVSREKLIALRAERRRERNRRRRLGHQSKVVAARRKASKIARASRARNRG
jgi:hypothetical protein